MDSINKAEDWPESFGLRAFPGQRFCINWSASYGSMLYVFTADGAAFCKGTAVELSRELTP